MEIQVVTPTEKSAIGWAQKRNAKVLDCSFMGTVRRWHDNVWDVNARIMGDVLGDIQSVYKLKIEGGEFNSFDENALFIPNRHELFFIEQGMTA